MMGENVIQENKSYLFAQSTGNMVITNLLLEFAQC